ncbi:hypothetical protein APHAL10511_000175 [Amanita phalloides]|nr:hypothetical protein APHAL10511_000175 [Amanita phalloides]
MAVPVFLAGLGNLPYALTRHSVGHLIVDALALRLAIRLLPNKHGFLGHRIVNLGDIPVSLTLFKSNLLMNVSGPSIASIYRKTVTSTNSFVLVTDSLLHPVETLSVKKGGSANGHNGVKSVMAALGHERDFYRFRIGIGRNHTDAITYVMQSLSSHERHFWTNEGLDLIISELESVAGKSL